MKQQSDIDKQIRYDNDRDPAIVYSYENKFRFKKEKPEEFIMPEDYLESKAMSSSYFANSDTSSEESFSGSKSGSILLNIIDFILDII